MHLCENTKRIFRSVACLLALVSGAHAQINVLAIAARGQAIDNLFFQSQEIRLLVWNSIWAAHKGQIVFNKCLGGKVEMASTADNPAVNKHVLAVGWPAKQKIAIDKKVLEKITKDGDGTSPPGGGGGSGSGGDDPKYLADAFLGAFYHELKHVLTQAGDHSIPAKRKELECQAFACELWFYMNIKNEDSCYFATTPENTVRRTQLCNRIEATKKLANDDFNCGF